MVAVEHVLYACEQVSELAEQATFPEHRHAGLCHYSLHWVSRQPRAAVNLDYQLPVCRSLPGAFGTYVKGAPPTGLLRRAKNLLAPALQVR